MIIASNVDDPVGDGRGGLYPGPGRVVPYLCSGMCVNGVDVMIPAPNVDDPVEGSRGGRKAFDHIVPLRLPFEVLPLSIGMWSPVCRALLRNVVEYLPVDATAPFGSIISIATIDKHISPFFISICVNVC